MNKFKDNDGYIELQEMSALVNELALGKNFPKQAIVRLFAEADVDGDGKISFDGIFLQLINTLFGIY